MTDQSLDGQPRVLRSIDPERLSIAVEHALAEMERRMPSEEELAYIRQRKVADERASWAWQTLKMYAPVVGPILTAIGVAIWWLLTHSITIRNAP